jgi:dethiobiotin synthetase
VGKTVLTTLLTRHLRNAGLAAVALKPICSGGRDDARLLRAACDQAMTLDEINPWHFRVPLAPLLAARKERRRIELREIVAHVHRIALKFPFVLVEGAGGLLSPLGEGFSTRELIPALGADVIVVARNQLGVINHVRLTLEAMPPLLAARARVALMSPKRPDSATRTNAAFLSEFIGETHVSAIPWIARADHPDPASKSRAVRSALEALLH